MAVVAGDDFFEPNFAVQNTSGGAECPEMIFTGRIYRVQSFDERTCAAHFVLDVAPEPAPTKARGAAPRSCRVRVRGELPFLSPLYLVTLKCCAPPHAKRGDAWQLVDWLSVDATRFGRVCVTYDALARAMKELASFDTLGTLSDARALLKAVLGDAWQASQRNRHAAGARGVKRRRAAALPLDTPIGDWRRFEARVQAFFRSPAGRARVGGAGMLGSLPSALRCLHGWQCSLAYLRVARIGGGAVVGRLRTDDDTLAAAQALYLNPNAFLIEHGVPVRSAEAARARALVGQANPDAAHRASDERVLDDCAIVQDVLVAVRQYARWGRIGVTVRSSRAAQPGALDDGTVLAATARRFVRWIGSPPLFSEIEPFERADALAAALCAVLRRPRSAARLTLVHAAHMAVAYAHLRQLVADEARGATARGTKTALVVETPLDAAEHAAVLRDDMLDATHTWSPRLPFAVLREVPGGACAAPGLPRAARVVYVLDCAHLYDFARMRDAVAALDRAAGATVDVHLLLVGVAHAAPAAGPPSFCTTQPFTDLVLGAAEWSAAARAQCLVVDADAHCDPMMVVGARGTDPRLATGAAAAYQMGADGAFAGDPACFARHVDGDTVPDGAHDVANTWYLCASYAERQALVERFPALAPSAYTWRRVDERATRPRRCVCIVWARRPAPKQVARFELALARRAAALATQRIVLWCDRRNEGLGAALDRYRHAPLDAGSPLTPLLARRLRAGNPDPARWLANTG